MLSTFSMTKTLSSFRSKRLALASGISQLPMTGSLSSRFRVHRCAVPRNDFFRKQSPSQIHFDHPLVRRNLIDGSLRQHRAFVQAGHLDAELADEGHVVFDDHDRLLA